MRAEILFRGISVHTLLQKYRQSIREEIHGFDDRYLLGISQDKLLQYFRDKYSIVVPALHTDHLTTEQVKPDQYDRFNGLRIATHIPFTGDEDAFHIQPSRGRYTLNPPKVEINNTELIIYVDVDGTYVPNNPKMVKKRLEETLELISENLDGLRQDVEDYNQTIDEYVQQILDERLQTIRAQADFISELGYPVKKRDDMPLTYNVSASRQKLQITPPTKAKAAPLEPTLHEDHYLQILGTIQNMAIIMERSPGAFRSIGEEDLRWLFLFTLNGYYEVSGQVTGETFNFEGKTDILIRVDGKNIFIAECKFWNGPKKFSDTIDQLLGYASWRDTKTAIIVFNRNKNFSDVLKKIHGKVVDHPNYLRTVEQVSETQIRYVFAHRDDAERKLFLTVLAFEVPV